ncbi:MAG: 1-acyl-sn-glycerol-3-phosphate acyltransferase [Prochlorococcus marinus XMU1428]|nr:1-acyl-sn-glycerol-3-phosphate acyltransferase [Prochlorococcus marinus XMU1428]
MLLTQDIVLKVFFRKIKIQDAISLPKNSSIILAPTHRSRWDGLVLTKAIGRRVTGKDCRFMVTKSEMKGIQGWFLRRLGCFSINQISPSLTVLRYAVKLIVNKNQLVVFPEGKINKNSKKIILKEGLYRLALLASKKTKSIFIIPIGIAYSQVSPKIRGEVSLCFGEPLIVDKNTNLSIKYFNEILNKRMSQAEKIALKKVGR